MKTHWRWSLAAGCLIATLSAAAAAERAIVTADQVNVRGQARLNSEVVTQLREGEEVLVLEEVPVKNPQPGEPAVWARIQLPPNTPVWVFAPYIEADRGVVNVSRLNVRSGPGENYSVLGRLERGTAVKEISVQKNWMEIAAPEGAHAFVAANFLKRASGTAATATSPQVTAATPPSSDAQPGTAPTSEATSDGKSTATASTPTAPADTTETDLATTATPAQGEPPTTQPVEIEAAPAAPIDSSSSTAATSTTPTAPSTTTTPEPEADARRVVSREGRVIISRSIQAPTDYALESLDTRRTINYLHSEDLGVNLRIYAGRKVIVTGEELMDKRWTRTPIVEVESIRLVP